MTLIARMSKLFQADIHAVLDKIEEPEILLKQAIREMSESIATQEQTIRSCENQRQQLTGKQSQLLESLSDIQEKLALCFQSDKDDLARLLIKRKLETQQSHCLISEKITAYSEKISRLTQQLTEHQAQLAGMQQKADAFLDKDKTDIGQCLYPPLAIPDEEVEVEFLSAKQKWSTL